MEYSRAKFRVLAMPYRLAVWRAVASTPVFLIFLVCQPGQHRVCESKLQYGVHGVVVCDPLYEALLAAEAYDPAPSEQV